ncbi:antitermination protein Q [Candidatus Symbiopectobacterium sp. NZEC127]|uniref:antiterminator Q family protein n=1 Tax=Candidatus Symbiopectobacterium sp. NZEC127 TaxID=2820472 RepID=UPI002226E511|nr:antiterminator Q family protein [Candidatus Symbiopectobacterium sp. NZEC127]MCW2484965.1 antitermination protein Q [Candidatus Symbiopectobacterium sp. NZEC127]
MRDISMVLERWAGWAASDGSGVDYSHIAAGFKGLLPQKGDMRLSCTDDDGLIIEKCLTRLKEKRPYEYQLLVAHYLYQISKRKLARWRKRDEKVIRVEMQLAEGFIDGCLAIIDARLDMDCEVR